MASRDSTILFLIVAGGEPIYEMDASQRQDDSQHLNQFVAHSALDLIDSTSWTNSSTSLKCIDRFQDKSVSAFITFGSVRFLLVHDGRNEDSIRTFFSEVHEQYVKLLMSPFTEHDAPITSTAFDKRVRALAKKIL